VRIHLFIYGRSIFISSLALSLGGEFGLTWLEEGQLPTATTKTDFVVTDLSEEASLHALPQLMLSGLPLIAIAPEQGLVFVLSSHSCVVKSVQELAQVLKEELSIHDGNALPEN